MQPVMTASNAELWSLSSAIYHVGGRQAIKSGEGDNHHANSPRGGFAFQPACGLDIRSIE
jgi:hypothetical protein